MIFKYLQEIKEEKETRKKYIEDERKYKLENKICDKCKFIQTNHWSDGKVSFKCKITSIDSIRPFTHFPTECEYFKAKRGTR